MEPMTCPSCGVTLRTHGKFDDDGEIYDAGPITARPVVCVSCLAVLVADPDVRALAPSEIEALPPDVRESIDETLEVAASIAMKSEA